jgi:hypothetical protein
MLRNQNMIVCLAFIILISIEIVKLVTILCCARALSHKTAAMVSAARIELVMFFQGNARVEAVSCPDNLQQFKIAAGRS